MLFDRAMSALTKNLVAGLLYSYDFAAFDCIVDIGGGWGALLGGSSPPPPRCRGVLFDRPQVVADAPPVLAKFGAHERCAPGWLRSTELEAWLDAGTMN